jgi:glycerophosphoryl diester phosphodiesterase
VSAKSAYDAVAAPLLIGHRGLRTLATENSLEAIEAARRQGAGGVEIDVRPTADGTLVLMHDATLARTAGDARRVAALHDAEIAGLRLQRGERIPTLAEVLALCRDLDLLLNVELKRDVESRIAASRAAAATLRGVTAPVIVSSFDPLMLATFAGWARDVPIALLVEPEHRHLRHLARPLGVRAIHPCRTLVSADSVARYRRAGLRVMSWTVNDPTEAAFLLSVGVDGIITDDPEKLRHLFP